MKKRIISVLLFLVVVMCLTACGKTPSEYVVYDEVTTVAREVRDNPDYQLPEGYTIRDEEKDGNNRIVIITKDLGIHAYCKARYDMTQETPKLLEFEHKYKVEFIIACCFCCLAVIEVIAFIVLIVWIRRN